MYTKEYELRYSDKDIDGEIKKSTVIDLLQDVSIVHSHSVGLDTKKFMELGVVFLLAGWHIKFAGNIDTEKGVCVKTGLMKITGCETYRKYEIWQEDECKVIATAIWFTVNPEKMRIARMPEEVISSFGPEIEEDNNLPFKKLKPAEDVVFTAENVVGKSDLDTNQHMNNMKSAELALNYLPDGYEVGEIQVKYRKEIKVNDKIRVFTKNTGDGFIVELHVHDEACVLVHIK